MQRLAVVFALAMVSCGAFHQRAAMPRPPFCVRGGNVPVEGSMDDYGATYTPEMQRGPVPAAPSSYLVPESSAGPDCVAPPWWDAPEPYDALEPPVASSR